MPARIVCLSVVVVFLLSPGTVAAQPAVVLAHGGPCAAPLDALHAAGRVADVIEDMWPRSLTFRRQVIRLETETLVVSMRMCLTRCPGNARAQTAFTRDEGILRRADVQIALAGSEDMAEVIGHELEHILEQLDGVDLPRLARSNDPGVKSDPRAPDRYETARAHRIGLLVAAEYRAAVRSTLPCSENTP